MLHIMTSNTGGNTQDRHDWKEGTSIEAYCEGDWWRARILLVDGDRVKIHYDGGEVDEDEWITKDSERLRPSQKLPKARLPRNSESVLPADETRTESDKSASGEQRPIRRSRIMSDDARLAMQLQEQEVKAAREMKAFSRKRTAVPTRSRPAKQKHAEVNPHEAPVDFAKKQNEDQTSDTAEGRGSRTEHQNCSERLATVSNARKKSCKEKEPAGGARKSPVTRKSKQGSVPSSAKEDVEGMVSFSLAPDDSLVGIVPDLKRNSMSLAEDMTVFHVKRHIIDEVLADHGAVDIEIRTTSGILLGQDHSLRYVRTILWPRSKGELILKYSLRKDSLL